MAYDGRDLAARERYGGSSSGEPRHRLHFEFLGDLDDVPSSAAATLAHAARLLLHHTDGHEGREATVRICMAGERLSLSLTDPECSPACVDHGGRLDGLGDQRLAGLGRTSVVTRSPEGGGLLLEWSLSPDRPWWRSVLPAGRRARR